MVDAVGAVLLLSGWPCPLLSASLPLPSSPIMHPSNALLCYMSVSSARLCATEQRASFVYRRVCPDRLRRHPMRGRKSRSCCCYPRHLSSCCCCCVSTFCPIWPDQPVEDALNQMTGQRNAVIWPKLNAPSETSLIITGAWAYMKTSSNTKSTSSESGAHPPVLEDSGRR